MAPFIYVIIRERLLDLLILRSNIPSDCILAPHTVIGHCIQHEPFQVNILQEIEEPSSCGAFAA